MATEELQLQGESLSKRLDWTVGAYYDNIRPTEYYPQSVPYFLGTAAAIQNNTVVGTTDQSVAGYAQATYDLSAIVRGLKITGGFRHTREGLSIQEDAYSSENTCFLNPALVFPTCGINASLTDSANTYNLDLDYEVAPRTNVYVAVRSGFKTGGLNPSAPTRYITYGPEHLTSYETGFKSEFEIHQVKGRVSTDVYLSDYTDIQVEQLLTNSNGTVSAITGNEGRARIKGFEFEGALFPTASIELSASYAFTDAHYLVAPADAPAGFTTLPNAPRNTFSASGRYHLPIPGDIGDLSLGGTYSYQSADYRGIVSYYTLYSGYGLLNADLTWNNFLSKPLDAAIFVTNATNKAYQAGGINIYSSFGIQADYYGPPRMVGVRMNYHF
jgi:iron complex outermembrane receptor protein